jgi:hypothetical protein
VQEASGSVQVSQSVPTKEIGGRLGVKLLSKKELTQSFHDIGERFPVVGAQKKTEN